MTSTASHVRRPWAIVGLAGLVFFRGEVAWCFENAEHKYISNSALTAAAADGPAPDIAKYQNLTLSWTYGLRFFTSLCGGLPAEQLAHIQDQTQSFQYTAAIDGGNFDAIRRKIFTQYMAFNFNNQDPKAGPEGAYVWLGAAMHLIEDQASLPHAANVWHSYPDNFEGPLTLSSFLTCGLVGKTGGLPPTSPGPVSPGQEYSAVLGVTQALILSSSLRCPISSAQTAQCYLFNDQLYPGTPRYQGLANQQATVDQNGNLISGLRTCS